MEGYWFKSKSFPCFKLLIEDAEDKVAARCNLQRCSKIRLNLVKVIHPNKNSFLMSIFASAVAVVVAAVVAVAVAVVAVAVAVVIAAIVAVAAVVAAVVAVVAVFVAAVVAASTIVVAVVAVVAVVVVHRMKDRWFVHL